MKHPVYFYCMLAVCCVFVSSKFLTRAADQGSGDNYYRGIIKTPEDEERENFEQAKAQSLITHKQEQNRQTPSSEQTPPPPYTDKDAREFHANQQKTMIPMATAAQPYSWQYYLQMAVAKANALQNYLAARLTALRTYLGW
ncbi:hypothetical protein JST99_05260 [Candidatus Dependentiae bacterium]|nr:hypothetical protein [Candidatus Dependentiae bacterium]